MNRIVFLSSAASVCLAASLMAAPTLAANCPQISSSARSQALDRRVEAGDGRAAYCLASHLDSLDGGELEDAIVTLGQYGDRHPAELLKLAHRGALSIPSLVDAVSNLPPAMSDDMHRQLAAMKARHDRYSRVGEAMLAPERRTALQSIDSALSAMSAHASDR